MEISFFKRLPEKRGRVSSGYMLASWMESWDRLTLYKGGRGPCVPYRMFPGFCSTIRLEYAHSFDSSTCSWHSSITIELRFMFFRIFTPVNWHKEDVHVMKYLHQLHGNLIYFPAGVWGLEQHQIEQGHQITRVISKKKTTKKKTTPGCFWFQEQNNCLMINK